MEKIMSHTITEVITNNSDVNYDSWEDFFENGLYVGKSRTDAFNEKTAAVKASLTPEELARFNDITPNIEVITEWDIESQTATRTKTYNSLDDYLFIAECVNNVDDVPVVDTIDWISLD